MKKEDAEYQVAILGFGIVGKGVYEIIKNNETEYLDNIDVKYIFDKAENVDRLQKEHDDVIFTSDIEKSIFKF